MNFLRIKTLFMINSKVLLQQSICLVLILTHVVSFVACEELPSSAENEIPLTFNLPDPPDSVMGGSNFSVSIQNFELERREAAIYAEVSRGNLPHFLRELVPVKFSTSIQDNDYTVSFYVMPDYLSIGSDDDHLLMPMTPILAQKVMDLIGGILPTRKMVDLIWEAALVKMEPAPIAPSDAMVTMVVFNQHNNMVQNARMALIDEYPLGELIGGHKKDVIISNRITENLERVVIYGWHYPNGTPIQPLYSGHVNWYADYSHGIRAVLSKCMVNDTLMEISDILSDPLLHVLLSDESGPMELARYDTLSSNYP